MHALGHEAPFPRLLLAAALPWLFAFVRAFGRLDARRVLLEDRIRQPLGALALEFPFHVRPLVVVYYFFHVLQCSFVGILVVLLFLLAHDVGVFQLGFAIHVLRDTRTHAEKYQFSISES